MASSTDVPTPATTGEFTTEVPTFPKALPDAKDIKLPNLDAACDEDVPQRAWDLLRDARDLIEDGDVKTQWKTAPMLWDGFLAMAVQVFVDAYSTTKDGNDMVRLQKVLPTIKAVFTACWDHHCGAALSVLTTDPNAFLKAWKSGDEGIRKMDDDTWDIQAIVTEMMKRHLIQKRTGNSSPVGHFQATNVFAEGEIKSTLPTQETTANNVGDLSGHQFGGGDDWKVLVNDSGLPEAFLQKLHEWTNGWLGDTVARALGNLLEHHPGYAPDFVGRNRFPFLGQFWILHALKGNLDVFVPSAQWIRENNSNPKFLDGELSRSGWNFSQYLEEMQTFTDVTYRFHAWNDTTQTWEVVMSRDTGKTEWTFSEGGAATLACLLNESSEGCDKHMLAWQQYLEFNEKLFFITEGLLMQWATRGYPANEEECVV